jgi:dienelactone hydrolase
MNSKLYRAVRLTLGVLVWGFAAPLPAAEVGSDSQVRQLRQRIRDNFFIDPLPALQAETHRRFNPAPGVTAEAVTYGSQFGLRVPAILYLPKPLPKGRLPAFIVVNGHGGDKYAWYAYYSGITYARAGAAVLTFDPAGEGERDPQHKSGSRTHDKLKGDEIMGRRLGGLLMSDIMQGVSYLASRPEVDPARIGAGGYSLGSFILSLTGAVEPRLRACVLVGGGNLDGPGEYWDNSKPMCQGFPYRSLSFLGDRPAIVYALHAARGPTLIWNGRADTVVNMPKTQDAFFKDLHQRAAAARGASEGLFEFNFVPDTSHRPFFVTKPVAHWLEKQLDFPNWTAADLDRLPETHISEWARQNSVAMDRLYVPEEREGGTMAVGTNVPGYRPEDLNVLPEAEWQVQKARFVFTEWEKAARAAGGK